ncbi:MAG: MBL fold metallo-hydrolase, partial [Gemmatimonadetes bacterium]|nr:MBL fold metallo-hydrolase [Gemmatimonadota bacterium]
FVDVLHRDVPSAIGTGVLEYGEGVAIIDPGPTTCLSALERGLVELGTSLADVRAVLLTHIHLDHATASGTIVSRVPEARVYVHPRGAIHMIDPTRLLASAGRIYGDEMEALWGDFLPVPAESVVEIDEGDVVELGDRTLEIAYTPGHAKHHVAYFERDTSTAWVGDVGGIRIPPGRPIPVTPPPDIDVEAWNASMDRVAAWEPTRIVPTHFGPAEDPAAHFAELRSELESWATQVERSLAGDTGEPDTAVDAERAAAFAEWVVAGLRERMPADAVDTYVNAFGAGDSWWGLARYWRKKTEG